MRLIVLGAGGQLGTELARCAAARGFQVAALDHAACDVTDPVSVETALAGHGADGIVNCAAWTAVDAAEAHPEAAARINVDGARTVAEVAAAHGTGLVHISTDYVFDGTATSPMPESAAPNPQSVYGRTKLDGELAVRATHPRALVVRTGWLFGTHGPNFVLTMLRLMDQGVTVRVVDDQRGAPTWTGHLAPALLRLLERAPAGGTYHLTNGGETTWHGLAAAIAAAIGAAMPAAIPTSAYPTAARRPAYSVLANEGWRCLGEPPLPPWQEGVAAYLEELGRGAGR